MKFCFIFFMRGKYKNLQFNLTNTANSGEVLT